MPASLYRKELIMDGLHPRAINNPKNLFSTLETFYHENLSFPPYPFFGFTSIRFH